MSIGLPGSNLESVRAKRTRLIAFVTATIIAAIATIITASVVIATTIVITHVLAFVV